MGERFEQILHQKMHIDGKQAHEKTLSNISHKGKAKLPTTTATHILECLTLKCLITLSVGVKKSTWTLIHCCWECEMVQPYRKTVCHFVKKLNMFRPYNPATPFLHVYPRKMKI